MNDLSWRLLVWGFNNYGMREMTSLCEIYNSATCIVNTPKDRLKAKWTQIHYNNIWLHNDYGPTWNSQLERHQTSNRCGKPKVLEPNILTSCNSCAIKRTNINKRPKGPHIMHLSTMWNLFEESARAAIFVYHKSAYFCWRLIFSDFAGEQDSQKYFSKKLIYFKNQWVTCKQNSLVK